MRHPLHTLPAIAILAAAIASSSCGSKSSQHYTDESLIDTTLHALDVDLTLFSTSRSFLITDSANTDTTYLAVSADIQWPRIISHHNIENLQNQLKQIIFDGRPDDDIQQLIINYVSQSLQPTDKSQIIKPIKTVAAPATNSWYESLFAQFIQINKNLLTYRVETISFEGGAHPNSSSRIITYDILTDRILTLTDIVSPDKTILFTIGAKKQLADQLEMSPGELNQTLLADFTLSENIYIQDGTIYIHYNPYEILPYAYGAIDIEMSPYEYSSLLTPYAQQLLLPE